MLRIFTTPRLLIILLVCALASGMAQEAESLPVRLKMVFWNVEWFPGNHPKATNAEAVAQIAKVTPELEALNPDILGMVEILNWDAAALAVSRVQGMNVQVCSDFLDDAGAKTFQQAVIASRLPALGGWWEAWKAAEIHPKRGFSFAAFQPAPGEVLLVYCVHLKSNRGEAAVNFPMREESARQLLDHAVAMEKAYGKLGNVSVVMGGDFNTSSDDKKFASEATLSLFEKAGYAWCWAGIDFAKRVTLPSQPSNNPKYPPFPDACFDHVFVKGAKILSAAAPVPEAGASDHRPVVVEIELPKPKATR